MIRFLFKSLVRGLLLILLVPLLILALLASETVNRWLFEQVQRIQPELTMEFVDGHFWRGWSFDTLHWDDGDTRVAVRNLQFQWAPECLWGLTVCIDRLSMEHVHVWLPDTQASEDTAPLALPELNLPLGIRLESFTLGALQLGDEPPLLQSVELKAHASANQLVVEHFAGQGPDLSWQLDADLRTKGDWPLRLDAHLQLPEVDQRAQQARFRLSGTLAEVAVDVQSEGYLSARLQGTVRPLDEHFPVQLSLHSDSFLALQELPPGLTLEGLKLYAEGDMQQGIRIQADARLPGSGGGVAMAVSGLATLQGLPELELLLQVEEQPERQLQLNGQLGWAEQLQGTAQLQLQQTFPWYWLYPQDTGAISLQQADLQLQLQNMDYQGSLAATLSGVAGQAVELDLVFTGNDSSLDLSALQAVTAAGSLQGRATLEFAEGLVWDALLQLQSLDPGVFVAQMPGQLSGEINTQGRLQNQALDLGADWRIDGRLRNQPLQLEGQLQSQEGRWILNDLLLRQGENRIAGQGRWSALDESYARGELDLQLPQLGNLWPGLAGTLQGRADLVGGASAPRLELRLDGRRLAYADTRLARLQLIADAQLDQRLPGQLSLELLRIAQGTTRIGNLSMQLRGELAEHRLDLELDRGLADLQLALSGSWHESGWLGELRQALLASGEMEWQLGDPARIDYRAADGRLQLSAHCWQHQEARLCFDGNQQLAPEQALQITLRDFPMSSLVELLPEDFNWDALLQADLSFRQRSGSAPEAHVHLRSEEGAIELLEQERTLRLPYQRLELDSRLQADQARNRLRLSSDSLGHLEVNADLRDPAGRRELSGDYRLEGLRLDVLQPFLPLVDSLRGELNGSGRLAGTLEEPAVDGVLLLDDGYVSGAGLPVSLEQMQLRLRLQQASAELDGSWQSGDQGEARLSGRFDWSQALQMNMTLNGNQLPVRVDPWASLLASPDLRVRLNDGQLTVTGQIAIPEGDIDVRELPETAVQLSPDVVILGEEAAVTATPLDIRASVQLLIGDQLRLSAFGLQGRLSGQLEVEENLNANGDLNILDGQYRGYGQRLSLRRAQLLFAGPVTQPFLNIEAIRTSGDVVAGLRLTGRADSPQSEVFSEPAMAQEQALSWLILGRPLGAGGGDENMLGQAALALGMAGSAPLAQNIANTLGIENFQLETEGSGLMTQVVAAGYLTDRLSLRYGVGVFEPANQLALRYDLTRRLYLEAVSGFASSLDFFYRIDFGSTQVQP